jgi:hypothetical protein
MSRYDSKTHDEVASRKSDAAQRRTKPADMGPPSPAKLAKDYAKGRERVSHKDWFAPDHRENQFPEDAHDNGRGRYENDVPLTGERSWLRGGGSGHRPTGFDAGPIHGLPTSNKSGKCEADGRNLEKSPFSAASKTYGGESRTVSNDRPSRKDIDNLYRRD